MNENERQRLTRILRDAMGEAGDVAPEPLTSQNIRQIAGIGINHPERLSKSQIKKLCSSVMAHIEPRR